MKLFLASFKPYKKNFLGVLLLTFSLLVVGVFCHLIGLVNPFIILVTTLFILIPFYCGFLFSCASVRHKQPLSNGLIIRSMKGYFTAFSGCFGIIFNLIKAILIGFVFYFIFSSLYIRIATATGAAWVNEFEKISSNISSYTFDQIFTVLTQNTDIYRFMLLSAVLSVGVGSLFFIIFVGYRSLNLFVRSYFLGIPKSLCNYFYKQNMRYIRGYYLPEVLFNSLLVIILYVVGYGLGIFFGLTYGYSLSITLTLSLLLGFASMTLLLPSFGFLIELLANKYIKSFVITAISSTDELIIRFRSGGLVEDIEALENIKKSLQARLDLINALTKE